MADIDTVRLLIGDRKKAVTREVITNSNDGIQRTFQLNFYPLISGTTASFKLYSSGTVMSNTATTTISGGLGRINLGSAITAGEANYVDYKYYALSSGELSDILSGYTGKPYLVAANACLILAADASRLFMYTMGDKTVDKRRVAQNLLDLSTTLENRHYKVRDDSKFAADIFTYDDSGTPYAGYDTAVATYLTGTS